MRAIGVVAALAVVPAVLVLPLPGGQAADTAPVRADVRSLPLTGVPAGALAGSPAPAADVRSVGADHDHDPGHDPVAGPSSLRAAAALPPTDVAAFGLVGVTSAEPFDPATRVVLRVRQGGDWTDWMRVPVSEHMPDPGTDEYARARYGTEPVVASSADGIQVRIDTPSGAVPADTRLVMIDNPVRPEDAGLGGGAPTAQATTSRPRIISRAEWGADESLKRGTVSYSPRIKVAFVHHVVSTNDYTEAQAAQQMRNVYSWFTQGIQVNDFGYNFMVDRFGRIYEGRAGGVELAVIGAHTAGFNAETFAVSFLGNADTLDPTQQEGQRIVDAMSRLVAWKFDLNHVNPKGSAVLTSAGPGPGSGTTSMYYAGEKVRSKTIAGHGDIGNTSCPGEFLRPEVVPLRTRVAQTMGTTFFRPLAVGSGQPWGTEEPMTLRIPTTGAVKLKAEIFSSCGDRVRTLRADTSEAGTLQMRWDRRDDADKPVPPGRYTVSITGTAGGEDLTPWSGTVSIASSADAPADPCSPPEAFTVVGTGYGHGVGLSQWGAYAMALDGWEADRIVRHYYPGVDIGEQRDDVDVRVALVQKQSKVHARAEGLASGGALEVTFGAKSVTVPAGDHVVLSSQGRYVTVSKVEGSRETRLGRGTLVTLRWSGTRDRGAAGAEPSVLTLVGPGETLGTSGHRYRYGTVELATVPTPQGRRLTAVNILRIQDEYLNGIAEVVPTWPQAALRAQVIASRSYALAKLAAGVDEECLCHMDDGDGPRYDQTFRGYAVETGDGGDNWVKAVRATAGQAALWKGRPIPAFYTAATGGRTTSADDAWGGAGYPWSQSVEDKWSLQAPGNPYREWTVVASQERMNQIFGIDDIVSIRVSAAHASGSARTVTATPSSGSPASVSGSTFRSALGLRSAYLTDILSKGTVPDAPAPTGKVSLAVSPSGDILDGARVRMYGRVQDMRPGLVVQRQVRWDGVDWQNRERVTPGTDGRYSFTVTVTPKGMTYSWRVVVYEGSAIVAVSPVRTATVI
ncbi:MAG: FlgD immunoglobulin-like domain containing protein [bacterium]